MKTREELREKGQFWTPDWIAENMVRYVLTDNSDHIFDPAYGMGAFFVAAKKISNRKISFLGTDIDPELIKEIEKNGILESKDLKNLHTDNFVKIALGKKYKAIVANPPYLRHHRISQSDKLELKTIASKYLGKELDGRAGLHIYFLILCLLSLEKNGKMSFIVSSDICEGVFSNTLWKWIAKNYQIEAALTFNGNATPFPNIDTNPIILFIKNSPPKNTLSWARCIEKDPEEIKKWIESGFNEKIVDKKKIVSSSRSLSEAIETGLSRLPQTEIHKFTLGDFAYTMRGIATGNNNFFLLNKATVREFNLPSDYLIPVISRTRDLTGDIIDEKTFQELEKKNRPSFLLYINNEKAEDLPPALQRYLAYGEQNNVHKTTLIATRNPWFKMERRDPPAILFSYLGRRNSRFLINKAEALPLNGFLCIYPKSTKKSDLSKLIELLNHKEVLKNLFLVGKSYGSDAVKVEPRALERLPIPEYLVRQVGLIS